MDDSRRRERVVGALGPHARGGNPAELGVEQLDQLAGGLMVAAAKARHQPVATGLNRG